MTYYITHQGFHYFTFMCSKLFAVLSFFSAMKWKLLCPPVYVIANILPRFPEQAMSTGKFIFTSKLRLHSQPWRNGGVACNLRRVRHNYKEDRNQVRHPFMSEVIPRFRTNGPTSLIYLREVHALPLIVEDATKEALLSRSLSVGFADEKCNP